ncbi:MAG: COX15/CtaA family protein [Cellvibrionaceae bacterium]|nr:COX15/CtaA family protein [Cellvibrionaceae bacterium]MCV6625782.1 COX15/CtaA family protein [Cellvibrionaceae bacterium]
MLSSEQYQRGLTKFYRLTLLAFVLALIVVGLGAFTRLVDAGLGCPDWPGCYGHITWPSSQADKAAAALAFPDSPVDTSKTWPEMVHRYFAGSLGILVLAIAFLSLRQWLQGIPVPVKLPFVLLLAVGLQALLGMYTVTLKLLPAVVTAHLLGGFFTVSMLWLLCLRARHKLDPPLPTKQRGPVWFAALLLLLLVLQISLGGWTSTNYAALVCADLPTCQGQWWPEVDFQQGFDVTMKIGPNYEGGHLNLQGRTAIHVAHRLGALILSLFCLLFCLRLWRRGFPGLSQLLLFALLLQLGLGIGNISLALPLSLAVAHNIGAVFLLLVLITIIYKLYKNNQVSYSAGVAL